MGRDGEDRVRDTRVPWDAEVSRNMWSGVGVPETTQVFVVAWWLPPRGIGDDVAVLSQKRLDGPQDPGIANDTLDEGTPVEHLIAERRHLDDVVVGVPHIGWVLRKDPLDIRTQGFHLW